MQQSLRRSPDPQMQGELELTPRSRASSSRSSLARALQSQRLASPAVWSAHTALADAAGLLALTRVENLFRAACSRAFGIALLRLPSIAVESSGPSFVVRRSATSRRRATA